jgi:hypothetical protein
MHLKPDQLIDLAEGGQGEGAAHLRSCETCRAEVAALTAVMASAASVEVPDPSPLFWNHLSGRVREGIAAEGSTVRGWGWATAWRPSWSSAALAGVAAAVAIAIFVTAPRGWSPLGTISTISTTSTISPISPVSMPADTAAEFVLQPLGAADDPSLTLVADLTGELDADAMAETGWANHAGGVEEAVANLTDDERVELHRLLKEALEKRDAS